MKSINKYDYSNMYYPYMPYDTKKGLYYNTLDISIQNMEEDYDGEDEMDIENMKKLYPEIARMIQYYIEEACDRMEYEGSCMYHEYLDKEAIMMIIEQLYEKINSTTKDLIWYDSGHYMHIDHVDDALNWFKDHL